MENFIGFLKKDIDSNIDRYASNIKEEILYIQNNIDDFINDGNKDIELTVSCERIIQRICEIRILKGMNVYCQ